MTPVPVGRGELDGVSVGVKSTTPVPRSPVGGNSVSHSPLSIVQSTTSPSGATPVRVASNLSPNQSQSSISDQPGVVVQSSATGAEGGEETLNVNAPTFRPIHQHTEGGAASAKAGYDSVGLPVNSSAGSAIALSTQFLRGECQHGWRELH